MDTNKPTSNPKFYWTKNSFEDSLRINQPYIKKHGNNEDRINDTLEILNSLDMMTEITLDDVLYIQNRLLSKNNWKKSTPGYRFHNYIDGVPVSDVIDSDKVEELTSKLFPVRVMSKELLLEWYKQIMLIRPLSDLNGTVFGIIVSILYKHVK